MIDKNFTTLQIFMRADNNLIFKSINSDYIIDRTTITIRFIQKVMFYFFFIIISINTSIYW